MAQPGSKEWNELHPDLAFNHQTGTYGHPAQDVDRFEWPVNRPGDDHPDGGQLVRATLIEPVSVWPLPPEGESAEPERAEMETVAELVKPEPVNPASVQPQEPAADQEVGSPSPTQPPPQTRRRR